MIKSEKIFLDILRDSFHPHKSLPIINETVDWMQVLSIAENQNLLPLIYDAVTDYVTFNQFKISHPQYFTSVAASVAVQMNKNDAFLELYKSFLDAGLAPITLKGIICRDLYGERADLRPSGDEDLLIEKKDFKKAKDVFLALGYTIKKQPDNEIAVIQQVPFYSEDLTVELHLNPFGTDSTIREKMNDWFRDVFQSEETVEIKGVPVRTLTPTDHILFLVFHAFKHFTGGGFGVRMMIDILLFAEKHGERIDWEYVKKGLVDVGAVGFFADLVVIGNRYLGFSLSQLGTPVCPDELLDDMFARGTFGNGSSVDWMAGRMVANTVQKNGKAYGSKVTSFFRLLFPSWRTWCAWRPYLKDKPWMVVCEWVWRVGRYLRGETSTSNIKDLDRSYRIAEERMVLLEKYGVI